MTRAPAKVKTSKMLAFQGGQMHNLLWSKLENQENIDFHFEILDRKIGPKKFGVHKLVLCSRSNVFDELMKSDQKVARLILIDTTTEVFEKFIR